MQLKLVSHSPAHVACKTLPGLRSTILSSSWTSSCSPVRNQCSVMRNLLEMSWLASKDLWWSSWSKCLGYVGEQNPCVDPWLV